MKLSIIADIHSNLEAFTEVINDSIKNNVDGYFFLGDIIDYGPNPNEVVSIMKTLKLYGIVMGNHEEILFDNSQIERLSSERGKQAFLWTKNNLTIESIDFLYYLKKNEKYKYNDIGVMAYHASPIDTYWHKVSSEYLSNNIDTLFGDSNLSVMFLAHSHEQIDISSDIHKIVNPGSVGQPRDGKMASYAIYDTFDKKVIFRRVKYNFKITADKIRTTSIHPYYAKRLGSGI